MIHECRDPIIINGIANHDDVAEGSGLLPDEVADYTDALNNPGLVFLVNDTADAMTILEFKGPGIWEIHSLFLKTARGRRGIQIGKAMLEHMREKRKAEIIWGQTPIQLRAARMFNKWCGLESVGYGVLLGVGPVEYFRIRFAH
jgi:hypothetical protein